MTTDFLWNFCRMTNIPIRKLCDHWILPIFRSENSYKILKRWPINVLIKLDDYWIFYQYSNQKIRRPLNSSNIGDHGILILDFCWNSSRIRWTRISYKILQGFHLILDFKDDTIVKYVMKLRFGIKNQTDERTNGDIEALADARRALKNQMRHHQGFGF